MAEEVSDFVLKRLREWGVEQVFAYPGDGINGLVAAFGRADNNPRFVQARHEELLQSLPPRPTQPSAESSTPPTSGPAQRSTAP